MDKRRRKSIHKSAKAIFKKAEAREKAGGDHLETGWQATLELMLLMMEEHLLENPGQLLPMQISEDDEWDFYLDVMEKLDPPPDTGAVLVTPSAFKDMKLPGFSEFEESEMAPWKRNAYSLIISRLRDHTLILQASLPGLEFAGIDIFKEYDTLARAIETTNDINRDMDLGEPDVTEDGILRDDKAQCQALLNRITVEIDMKLDMLSYQKGVIVPGRNIQNPDYTRVFNETARRIYMVITERGCPESVKVM